MRQLFFLLFTFFSLAAAAQTATQYLGAPNTVVLNRGHLQTDSTFRNAIRDTTFTPARLGIQVYRQADSSLYVSVATTVRPYWARVGSSGGSGAIVSVVRDSIFIVTRDTTYYFGNLTINPTDTTGKWVQNATLSAGGDSLIVYKNGIRTATKITGAGGGSTAIDTAYTISTKANVWRVVDSTLAAGQEMDSTFWSTRAWRQKGIDSVAALLVNYLSAEVDPGAIHKTGTTALTGNVTIDGGSSYYTRLTNTRFLAGKGSNVAAANNLTLGNDGNLFTITGNTQINALTTAGWQAGAKIDLLFTGTPKLKHNTAGGGGTAPLDLAGDADWTAAAGDGITLLYTGTSWLETTRKIAGVNGAKGSVTNFSFTNDNGFTGTVSNATTTPALSLTYTPSADQTVTVSTNGQTSFTFTGLPATAASLILEVNGGVWSASDFSIAGNTITVSATDLAVGDKVTIHFK